MATKTTKKPSSVTTEQQLAVLQEKHQTLVSTVSNYITGVDNLFKADPSKQELGSNMARFIAELEKAIKH